MRALIPIAASWVLIACGRTEDSELDAGTPGGAPGLGLTLCGGRRVDVDSDVDHCGVCDNRCAAHETCFEGSCVSVNCEPGAADCNADPSDGCEVDLGRDPGNCGSCGLICSDGASCAQGTCSAGGCLAAQRLCGIRCVDTFSDVEHCGSCNNACPPGADCVAGTCACSVGRSLCGNECVDLAVDPDNCGACAAACADGTCRAGICGD